MNNKNGKTFVDSLLDTQKSVMDTIVENTRKMTNGNPVINEALDKGAEQYEKLASQQKNFFKEATTRAEKVSGAAKENADKVNDQAQSWLDMQLNWAKKSWELNQEFLKQSLSATDQVKTTDPFEWMKDSGKKWNELLDKSNFAAQWWKLLQQYNPANAQDVWTKTTQDYTAFFKQYQDLLQQSFSGLQQNMEASNTREAYQNMINVASGFNKFYEIWAPFLKSVQEKTFDADSFKKALSFDAYKEMMDRFFGFLPDYQSQYFEKNKEMWTEGLQNMMSMNKSNFKEARNMMESMNPFAGTQYFGQLLDGYRKSHQYFQNAVAPIAQMATPNEYTRNAQEWSDIIDQLAVYNIKNAEMQSMVYQQGIEVMDRLAENIAQKIEKGEKIDNIAALYQEWLNLSDEVYVSLFESDAYSEIMAETAALQLKLKKAMELQTEKALAGFPIATKSELDELYKVIYDLKKEVHQLQKMLEVETTSSASEKPAASKSNTTAKATTTTKSSSKTAAKKAK